MRTSDQIQAEMDAVQDQYPDLKSLTSTSQVSFFSLLKNMWITLVMAVDQRVDVAIADITQAIANGQVGSLAWYATQIKAFQFGDSVTVYDGSRIGYEIVNLDKQVVKQATVSEQASGRLLVKAAKSNGDVMGPLSTDELIALDEYIRLIKFAGVAVDVISLPPDELKLIATVKYDRLVLGANGTLLANGVDAVAPEAVTIYIRSLPFDSVLNWTALTDALQKREGILDFTIQRAFVRASGTTAWTEFTRETVSRAGHMTLNVSESVFTYV